MRTLFSKFALSAVIAFGAAAASAQTAYVYAVHGIPGSNGFPVDIAVDGNCAVKGFTFANIAGPLSLSAGSHSVQIYGANTSFPCSGTPALSAAPNLEAGTTYALAAHLTAAAAPTLSAFVIDLSKTGPGSGRFLVHHTAAAPCVDVQVARPDSPKSAATVPNFCNGAQVPAEFRPGNWDVTLTLGGAPVYGPTGLSLQPKTVQMIFAVGVFPDSFTYVVKTVPVL